MTGSEVEASEVDLSGDSTVDQDRRAFLLRYGKVALVAPPVITTLLATSMSSTAIAQSIGGSGGGGGNAWLFGAGALPLAAIPARQAPAAVPLAQPAPPPVAAPSPVAAPPPAPPKPENYRVGERG